MKYKKWNQAAPDRSAVLALVEAGLPALAATVLCARGVDTPEAAAAFLAAADAPLHDPMLLRDMDRAVERMERALAGNEYIAVYGDYDVDGITSTCLLTRFLSSRGARVIPYIPDRLEEGYGLNREAVELLADKGVTLIVTVDCGITAVEEARYAASLGLDVIITDHHECKDELPQAVAVVDPHRRDCGYPFPCLAGVGVALKLALALTPGSERERVLSEYADLAAIGTVADVMQLSGENRAIVRRGLQALARTRRPGLRALIREAGAEGKSLTASCIGFTLAPRINAAGRMGCAPVAAELLLTEDPGRAEALSHALCALNRERQSIEGRIYEECLARLERESAGQRRSIVLAGEGWHQGVVGIVASRLAEKYACPTFMICVQAGARAPAAPLGASTSSGRWNPAPTCWRASAAMPWPPALRSWRSTSAPSGSGSTAAWRSGPESTSWRPPWRWTLSCPTRTSSPWRRWPDWTSWSPMGPGTPSRCSPSAAVPSPPSLRWAAGGI